MTVRDRLGTSLSSAAIKAPCRAATTANITLSGLQTIDGVSLVADDRVLVKNQTIASENGIYVVKSTAWERAPDWSGARDIVKGTSVGITDGTVSAGLYYDVVTANPITIGTTSITFTSSASPASSAAAAEGYKDDAEAAAAAAALSETNAGTSETNAAASELAAGGFKDDAEAAATAAIAAAANLPNATTAGADKFLQSNGDGDGWEYLTAAQLRSAAKVAFGGQAYEDIASATTIDLDAAASDKINVTGTTTTTAITLAEGQQRWLKAAAAWPITHGASLLVPGSANYTCAAGDMILATGEAGGVVRLRIFKADGTAVRGGGGAPGLFVKSDPAAVAFTKTGAGTASIKAGTRIDVAGTLVEFASATAITMPSLTAGTDYAIWVKDNATIQATTNFSSAPGAGNWRKIGGFHYAPGGNATGTSGGDTTPAINAYSFWDLKFRPACPDPRGMTLVADSFWADIYLCGVDHHVNGTSKYNVTIADGSSPPKKPLAFGGNGTTTQTDGNWWNLNEVLQSHGKRAPAYDEFAALAYGTTEASSLGSDPGSTVLNAAYTSKWGVIQSTGVMWVWGAEFGGGAAGASWAANTQGRGSTYQMENAARFGGAWGSTSNSGSRASNWDYSPTDSLHTVGVRGVGDHLILD